MRYQKTGKTLPLPKCCVEVKIKKPVVWKDDFGVFKEKEQ